MTDRLNSTALDRRSLLAASASAVALSGFGLPVAAPSVFAQDAAAAEPKATADRRFWFSAKSGMINDPMCKTWVEKFQLLKDLGYDGVEYDQALDVNPHDVAEASAKVGLPVQGVVNPYHWKVRLSDPDETVRAQAVKNMETALRFAKTVGASTVLLVPGRVSNPQTENFDQVWERSIQGIRRVIPLAANLGVRIGIENVWNQFLYTHDGPGDQSPDNFINYVDEIACTWVGLYFDFSNHRKYGDPAAWLRAFGSRVIKCDTKDFKLGAGGGFCDVGEGDVPWADVRKACEEINYYGWVSSEVAGGDRTRLTKVLADLKKVLF